MKRLQFSLFSALIVTSSLLFGNPSFSPPEEKEVLIVHNRILAKVDSKTISVIDVMKKMDLFLQKYYPQFIHSKIARYQFYIHNWKDYLSQMVDQELMLADAEHLEMKLSDAEVREEILERFGPNIMPTLDKLALTYDELRKMIKEEMLVQRMIWFRVNSKALHHVNSEDVKLAYKQFCEKNPALEEWEYQVVSIRSKDDQKGELLASKAIELLGQKFELQSLKKELEFYEEEGVSIHVSSDLHADEKGISDAHKQVLMTLSENDFSLPIRQLSRVDQSIVYRIFHLKKHSKKQIPSFEKMADELKEELLQKAAQKENIQYLTRLRERLGFDEQQMLQALPPDFEPFVLR